MLKRVVLLIALLAAGCTSYRPTAPLPAPATTVRVTFLSPRDVVARGAAGDSMVLTGVRELTGSVVRAQLDTRTDSLRIRLGSVRGPSGAISGIPDGAIATVPREVFVRVEQRSFDPRKTMKVVGYVALGALALVVLAIGLAVGGEPY